jgi:rod shape determining protein RodA
MMMEPGRYREHISVLARLREVTWGFVLLIAITAAIGFATLYSAGGGKFDPWATRQIVRFSFGLLVMFGAAMVDLRFWLRHAYLIYGVALLLLVSVEVIGLVKGGSQRWVDFGILRVQPSEVMKIALVVALARYFHKSALEDIARPTRLLVPLIMIAMPIGLVLKQPDLGTAALLGAVGLAVMFVGGVKAWKFAVAGAVGLAAMPIAWSVLHSYQRKRILSFLNPSSDPLGSGYHSTQSQIALGSGGVWGKGFLQGSQSHLSFIPESQTDFAFAVLAEEFGMMGALVLLALFAAIIGYGIMIALRSRNQFGRLLALGLSVNFFLYVFINIAMVTGIFPVVGVPLPLISYGGTAMLTLMFGFGLVLSVYINRDARIGRFDDEI